jgi:hypothetical protein
LRVIIVVVQVESSENICSSSAGAQEKRKEGLKLRPTLDKGPGSNFLGTNLE